MEMSRRNFLKTLLAPVMAQTYPHIGARGLGNTIDRYLKPGTYVNPAGRLVAHPAVVSDGLVSKVIEIKNDLFSTKIRFIKDKNEPDNIQKQSLQFYDYTSPVNGITYELNDDSLDGIVDSVKENEILKFSRKDGKPNDAYQELYDIIIKVAARVLVSMQFSQSTYKQNPITKEI